jgi:hypothetical protein
MSGRSVDTVEDLALASLPNLVSSLNDKLKKARKVGPPSAILAIASAAAEAIERRTGSVRAELSDEERAALVAVKAMLYTAAADCWPGWSTDTASVSETDLLEAMRQAQASAKLVDALSLGPSQQGTAAWLIGALYIALGQTDDAFTALSLAEQRYRDAEALDMALLAQGFKAIASEAGHRPLPDGVNSLEKTIEELSAGQFKDGSDWVEQLLTARQVFG